MSEDEFLVLVLSCMVSVAGWGFWGYAVLSQGPQLGGGRAPPRGLLLGAAITALLSLIAVLLLWSASDVRDDLRYLFMYSVMGMAWCWLARMIPPFLGLSFRHDVLHRGNHAAAWVHSGWLLAVMLAFAGGNVGDGPGWWVVVFSAALSTGALTLLFYIWEKLTHANDAVAIDRDLATGMRLFGLLVGCGAVYGVAVAGDWVSPNATIRDFSLTAWPSLLILLAALVLHFFMRPTPEQPRPSPLVAGVLPMLLLLALGFAWAFYAGTRVVGGVA